MDKNTKTILIVLGSVLVLCACAAMAVFATGLWSFSRFVNFAERSVSESPQVAVRLGRRLQIWRSQKDSALHTVSTLGK